MTDCPICGFDLGACEDCAHQDATSADEFHVLAEELDALATAHSNAGWWRRATIARDLAMLVYDRMPMIYSALVHHKAGMAAQRD